MANKDNAKVVLGLDIPKSVAQINSDIKKLEKQLKKIRTTIGTNNSTKNNNNNNNNSDKPDRSPNTQSQTGETTAELKKAEAPMRTLGKLATFFKKQLSQASTTLTQALSAGTLMNKIIAQTKEAITELKALDTSLTEISRTNRNLSQSDLKKIGSQALDAATKYGTTTADYLTQYQAMTAAGYRNADAMTELSMAAQSAGSLTPAAAGTIITTLDKAYQLGGSIHDLTKILDGANYICDNNALSIAALTESMTTAAPAAAALGVDAAELTAALASMSAATQEDSATTAAAFQTILHNLRQIADEEEGITPDGLAEYEKACSALGVSLTKTVNGISQTRDAMDVLAELSEAYNSLDKNDARRTALTDSLGSQTDAAQLDALLTNWDTYETLLRQYTEGAGTMAYKIETTAASWEGSLKRLHNTWVDTIGNIADSGAITTILGGLNGLLSAINGITGALGPLGSIGLGAGITSFVKNFA